MVGILVAKLATGCRTEAGDLYVVALIGPRAANARICVRMFDLRMFMRPSA
jgi:hypothetical protein